MPHEAAYLEFQASVSVRLRGRAAGERRGAGARRKACAAVEERQAHEAVHRLSYKYREVITLYYFQEMGVAEIADHLQVSKNTVKARLARGRAYLKQTLEKEGETDWT
ncbi:sigma-70 family RNA polymerase sigma factor [Paenibacillus sp. JTLBN-2024]